MPCASIRNFEMDICQTNIGGCRALYLSNYKKDYVQVGIESGATEGVITGVTSGTGVEWQEFPFRKDQCSFTSTLNVSGESKYVSTELTINWGKMDTNKRLAVQALVMGQAMGIVQDMNGKYWFLGKDAPLECTAGSGQTGAARADVNQYSVTLTDESTDFPLEMGADVVAKVLAGGE